MQAYDSYGSKCNGCGNYAEWCHCKIDSDGDLIEANDECNRPINKVNNRLPSNEGRKDYRGW